MVLWLLGLLPLPILAAAVGSTHGVHPSLLSRYKPLSTGKWRCLDGSKEIPWNTVNDDYCDCPDGSDEPGTSACPNGSFYCINNGHVGASVPSTRVNDGLCEPQCCDGSDEQPGVCKNTCKEVGEAFRRKRDEERAIQEKGAKIRASYIDFAQKERTRLDNLIWTTQQEIEVREREVERLRVLADTADQLSAADVEHKKQSPLYQKVLEHSHMLKSLHQVHQKIVEREQTLGSILEGLRTGYNPNYQDMAVLEAVRGWEALKGEGGEQHADGDTEVAEEQGQVVQKQDDHLSAREISEQIQALLSTDFYLLLLDHEKHINAPSDSTIFNVTAYLPDSLVPRYESFKQGLQSVLHTLGIVHAPADTSDEATRARKAHEDADHSLHQTYKEKEKAEQDRSKLFDVNGFGKEGEWKQLDGTCLDIDSGEYTYELCFFQGIKQKPRGGGYSHRLGQFSSWNTDLNVEIGSPEYYHVQLYSNGDKCWNGPFRSTLVVMSCGTENAFHTVEELEKCEYQITGTSPALCLPLDQVGEKAQVKGCPGDEL